MLTSLPTKSRCGQDFDLYEYGPRLTYDSVAISMRSYVSALPYPSVCVQIPSIVAVIANQSPDLLNEIYPFIAPAKLRNSRKGRVVALIGASVFRRCCIGNELY